MDKPITTFIFDWFGVVCRPVLNSWYKEHRLDRGFIDENIKSVFREFDLGRKSESDIVTHFLGYKEVNSTKDELRREIDNYIGINHSLVNVIRNLKRKNFKVALLSNANNSFFERKIYVDYPEFKTLFDEVVISSVVGMVKPDPDIYLYTLEKIHSAPHESLFIDDNQSNVDTALTLGMEGFLYTNNDSFVDYIRKFGVELGS